MIDIDSDKNQPLEAAEVLLSSALVTFVSRLTTFV